MSFDRRTLLNIATGESPRFGRRQTVSPELRHQLLLARQHASAKIVHIEPSRARLRENPFLAGGGHSPRGERAGRAVGLRSRRCHRARH
jgi:hypothetical protein